MTTDKVQQLYTARARMYEKWYVNRLGWGRELEVFFQKYDGLQPFMKVLDAGCGTGIVTRTLHNIADERGYDGLEFHAFDLTQNMLDILHAWSAEQGFKDIKLEQADVLQPASLPSDWNEYGLIVSSALLEYIPEERIGEALSNLMRLLKDGGRLLLFITRRNSVTRWTGKLFWNTNLFTEGQIQGIIRSVGVNKIKPLELPSRWSKYIMVIEVTKG